MKTVGAFEAKTHLAQLLNEVEVNNEEILIQRRGKNVAYIVPCATHDKERQDKKNLNIIKAFQEIRKKQKPLQAGELKELINAGRKW